MPANFQRASEVVAGLPISRGTPNPVSVSEVMNQHNAREHAIQRMGIANQYAKSTAAQANRDYMQRAAQSNRDYIQRMGIADQYSTRLSDRKHVQDLDRERLRHLMGEDTRTTAYNRSRQAAALKNIYASQATTGGYDAGPLGMTPMEEMAWEGATRQGQLAAKQRKGRDMYTYNLMREVGTYQPAEFRSYVTQGLMDHRATEPAMAQWMKKPSKMLKAAMPGIRQSGSLTGETLPPTQSMPDKGTAGYRQLQALYLTETGQMQPIRDEVENRLKAREYKQIQDRDMIGSLMKGGAAPWEYFQRPQSGAGPLGYGPMRSTQSISGAAGNMDLSDLEDRKASNPLGHAIAIGSGVMGGFMATKPYREASKFAASGAGRAMQALHGGEMQKALRTAMQEMDKTPATDPLRGRTAQGSMRVFIGAEVSRLAAAQEAILKANNIEVPKGSTPEAILKEFEKQAKKGRIKHIPTAQKKMLKKLGTGALGSVWKRAAAAVIGPTAAGSTAGPWGSVLGFTVGLGMAAWAAYDIYNLTQDLMSDDE